MVARTSARRRRDDLCYAPPVLTAAITAAIAAILSRFGIKPGAYLVGVVVVVKCFIVFIGLFIGLKLKGRRRADATDAPAPPAPKT
jgi:hypothetical protein